MRETLVGPPPLRRGHRGESELKEFGNAVGCQAVSVRTFGPRVEEVRSEGAGGRFFEWKDRADRN